MDNKEIIEKLNRLYWSDQDRYKAYLSNLKCSGYRVKRNSKGEHKVEPGDLGIFLNGLFGNKIF